MIVADNGPVAPSMVRSALTQTGGPRPAEAPRAPEYDPAPARDLVEELANLAPAGGRLSSADWAAVEQRLQALRRQGVGGVLVIEEFLASWEDVDFSRWAETDDLPYPTLRLALLETLGQILGPDALDAMVGVLAAVTDPREIKVLADGLEARVPGRYRQDIAAAARDALALAIDTDPKTHQGLRDLFGVIETYGDDAVAAALENVYKTEESAWADYALMALSKLPEGKGVPYLLGIADDLAATPGREEENRYRNVLRMLAQVSRQEPDAEVALLQTARSGQLSVTDIKAVAATLSGWEHELIVAGSEAAERFESSIYLNGNAPEIWTDGEIEQRMAMIDQLLMLGQATEAEQALRGALDTLAAWKERPMLNGKRVTR